MSVVLLILLGLSLSNAYFYLRLEDKVGRDSLLGELRWKAQNEAIGVQTGAINQLSDVVITMGKYLEATK